MNTTRMPRVREQSNWIRQFALQNYHLFVPCELQVRQAIAAHLPEQLLKYPASAEAQELLEEILGIAVIVKLGEGQIALSMTGDNTEAQDWQRNYNTVTFNAIRRELGIDSHWILLVNSEILFTVQDLYEVHMDWLEIEIQPECLIIPV